MSIIQIDDSSPRSYEFLLRQFLEQEFHLRHSSNESLLDTLTNIFTLTKENRYGRVPSPEVLTNIRIVLSHAIEHDKPIPILVPWGGKKRYGGTVDSAEISGLHTIKAIYDAVMHHYDHGVDMRLRIEDSNAILVYGEKHTEEIRKYTQDLLTLIYMLAPCITAVPESGIMAESKYLATAQMLVPSIYAYLVESDRQGISTNLETYKHLVTLGWRGFIPKEQRDWYRERYIRNDGVTFAVATQKLAEYFAGSLARYQLGGIGFPPGSKYIQMNFASPVPGTPPTMFGTTVYLRTVPMSNGRTHVSPWRAKGFIEITGDTPAFKVAVGAEIPQDLLTTTMRFGTETGIQISYRLAQ